MLTRWLRFRKEIRIFTRCLSDKPSDTDAKSTEIKVDKDEITKKKSEKSIINTEKIQSLLKDMLLETKVKEAEYKTKFAVAPEITRKPKQNPDVIEVKSEKIEESLTEAAGHVAQAIGGDIKQTEAELLSKVLGKINQSSTSLSDLILGMKVDRTKESEDGMKMETRGQQVKRHINKAQRARTWDQSAPRRDRPQSQQAGTQRERVARRVNVAQPTVVDIFAGAPLGIFKSKDVNYGTKLDTWEALKQRELTLATAQPPSNYFEKMAVWTKQGKVWKFPINNEQGYEEEAKVHFSEHVFLDTHLEGWCPKKGPVRHFMELVCAGLSKNPFYTVQEKKDHIMWYKEYFESKQSVLTEVGAWDVQDGKTEASV